MKLANVSRDGNSVKVQISFTTGELTKIIATMSCFLSRIDDGFSKEKRVASDLDYIFAESNRVVAKNSGKSFSVRTD